MRPSLPEPCDSIPFPGAYGGKLQVWGASQVHAYADACTAELLENSAWVPVSERLPESGKTVLACYLNSSGNVRRIRAVWIAAKSCEASHESDIGEYDEASDTYYDPEGWYEKIDNWDDYSHVIVNQGDVSHWIVLPDAPVSANAAGLAVPKRSNRRTP